MQRQTQFIIGSVVGVAATLGMHLLTRNRSSLAPASQSFRRDDPVEVASDDSFPASDPPSYTPTSASRPEVQ